MTSIRTSSTRTCGRTAKGLTPNPCIECNRHLKFDRLSERADLLGFDAIATGHHARIEPVGDRFFVHRGADAAKDQSYVVHMLPQRELRRTLFPVGHLTKAEVRQRATTLGLRTAAKPDSQDVCFITQTGGRETFLGARIPFRTATVVDSAGTVLGEVPAIEMVTLGQRRGIGLPGGGPKRYVTAIDQATSTVVVGDEVDLDVDELAVENIVWADQPFTGEVMVQCSAHGTALPATLRDDTVRWHTPPASGRAWAERGVLRLEQPLRPWRRHRPLTPSECSGGAQDGAGAARCDDERLHVQRCTASARPWWAPAVL